MDLQVLRLWDVYHPLLTENQREVTDLYYNCDLSLAEIAEQKGCSRQSISDTLSKARRQMEEYEEKLHFVRIMTESAAAQSVFRAELKAWAEQLPAEQRQRVQAMLDKDYAEELIALPRA